MVHASKAIFGIYRDKSEIKIAIHALRRFGFKDQKISVLYPEHEGPKDFPQVQKNQLGEGAIIGAVTGIGVVGLIGLLIWSGAVTSIAFSVFSAVDSWLMTLLSLTFGAVIGASCGALVGIGTPKSPGARYGEYIHAGGILLSVQSADLEEARQAKLILEKTGAQDISAVEKDEGWKTAVAEVQKLDRAPAPPLGLP